MIPSVADLIDDNQHKDFVISYIKTKYKEKTGEDIDIPEQHEPKVLESFPNEPEEFQDSIPNAKYHSFKEKVNALKLPSPIDKDAKARIEKMRRQKDKSIFIEKIDLSHFARKEISIDQLRRVVEGMKILKSVNDIDLSHNNLNDNYIDIICELFTIPGLHKINLSHNRLTANVIKQLNNVIKNAKHLESLDVSYNPFNTEEYACLTLCSAIKSCEKLTQFGLCDSSRDSGIRLLSQRPTITYLKLEDSRYKKKTFDSFTRYLSNKRFNLQYLSLKYTKIDFTYGAVLISRGLCKNKSLTYLNLYSTGLDDLSGEVILDSITKHPTLITLDIGGNFIGKKSCVALGKVLRNNRVIKVVDLSRNNYLTNEVFWDVIEGLLENITLSSLGDLIDTKIGVKFREITEKLIDLNKDCDNWRKVDKIKKRKIDCFLSNVDPALLRKKEQEYNNLIQMQNQDQNSTIQLKTTSIDVNQSHSIIPKLITSLNTSRGDMNFKNEQDALNAKDYDMFMSNNYYPEGTLKSSLNYADPNATIKHNDIVVKFSLPNTNYLKSKIEPVKNVSVSTTLKKSKKSTSLSKRTSSLSPNRSLSPKGKGKKTTFKQKVSILNTVASFVQEVIKAHPEIFEGKQKIVEKKVEASNGMKYIQFKDNIPYSERTANTRENLERLNRIKVEEKDIEDILHKYQINPEVNYADNDGEEQSIYGAYLS